MRLGLGLDGRLGLSLAQLRDLAREARDLGYTSLWTPSGPEYDAISLCVAWHGASGLATGTSVVALGSAPTPLIARSAKTAHDLTGGTFTLGIGSGRIADRPVAAVRDAIAEIRRDAPGVPVYVAALGPQMLRLAGKHADGVALNWCTDEHVVWSRERVGRGVPAVSYIRVCVDDDVAAARRALAEQVLAYAAAPGRAARYRLHFGRMGFGDAVERLAERRARGETVEALAGEVPVELLDAVGYAGPARGLCAAVERQGRHLDLAIVRVLSARPGDAAPVRAAMRAAAG